MQDSVYQMNDSVQVDNVQTEQVQELSATTVAVPAKSKSENIAAATTVTGISMVMIFVFMFIFFLVIKAIDKYFPEKG